MIACDRCEAKVEATTIAIVGTRPHDEDRWLRPIEVARVNSINARAVCDPCLTELERILREWSGDRITLIGVADARITDGGAA